MASKVPKHLCVYRIISHNEDMSRLLVMCSKQCTKTDILERGKVKVATRKYRPETDEEFRDRVEGLAHLCCP
jgi:hypothetical protein